MRWPRISIDVPMRMTQGKCIVCSIIFKWPTKVGPRLKDAFCPICAAKLRATTYLKRYRVVYRYPINLVNADRLRRMIEKQRG